MQKKTILLIIALLLIVGAIIGYLNYNRDSDSNIENQKPNNESKTIIEVSSIRPYNLDEITHEIKTGKYHKGYDNNTLSWMESLKQKNVFLSNNSYIIMNDEDASKVRHNTIDITDVYIVEKIECYVIENRSLSDNRNYTVVLVKNVTDLGNKTYYYEV